MEKVKKIALFLSIIAAVLWLSPAFAVPPPPPHGFHGNMVHAGHHMHHHGVYHRRPHGAVSIGVANSYGMNRFNSPRYYCPCYGVCYPFMHPGPQYSSNFYISY